jgi:uncharacterized protein YbcI
LADQTSPHPVQASNGTLSGSREHDAVPLGSAPSFTVEPADRPTDGIIAGAITTRMVGLLRRYTGRGPIRAKTVISSDLVLVTLADCFTAPETELAAAGHGELVVTTRTAVYEAIRDEAMAIVKGLTKTPVLAYLTAQHEDPDLAILVFYLAAPTARS